LSAPGNTDDRNWFKDAVIYEMHVKSFLDSTGDGTGDFRGLTSKLDYLKDLGVTAVWLLPFYPSPQRDDGYDISDYMNIHPAYGTLRDFREFLHQAHQRGLKVITELVLNHTSDRHPWFQASRNSAPGSASRNLYVWSDTPDKYKEARVIFTDFETSNWTWDVAAKQYYWHRFYSHQPDLNYDNPRVQRLMEEVVAFWLKMGVDGLRLDAVPYLCEKEGTNCENLPETHEVLKKLRTFVDSNFKDKLLIAEANQWPTEAVRYFGNGDECQMAFHFPLMPRMFMSIQMEDRFPILDVMDQTPPIPEGCQWATFLRNHDELTLEMVTDEERDYMYTVYARDKQARINLGIRRRLAPLLDNDRRKIELMSVLLFTLPGTPVIYYGDEIGMGDNYYLGDRNGVRTPMQWSADLNAGFSRSNPHRLFLPVIIDPKYHYESVNVQNQENDPSSLLSWMKNLISLKKHYSALRRGTIEFLFPDNFKVIAYLRRYGEEVVLVAANLSKHPQSAEIDLPSFVGFNLHEAFGGIKFPQVEGSKYRLTFSSYGYYIFSMTRPATAQPNQSQVQVPELALTSRVQELAGSAARSRLESILPSFLRSARWFGGKGKTIQRLRIRDVIPVEAARDAYATCFLFVVEVLYTEGLPEQYAVPMAYRPLEKSAEIMDKNRSAIIARVFVDGAQEGVLFDGAFDPEFRALLLEMVAKRRTARGEAGYLQGRPRPRLPRQAGAAPDSALLSADQSNTSMSFGDRFILKIFRKMQEGVNPEVEMGDALTDKRFSGTPEVLGDLTYIRSESEPITIGVLEELVKNQGDAWALFTLEFSNFLERVATLKDAKGAEFSGAEGSIMHLLESGMPQWSVELVGQAFAERVAQLGKRTAEFHLALRNQTQDPHFRPEPFTMSYQASLWQSMTSYANRVLRFTSRHLPTDEKVKELFSRVASRRTVLIGCFEDLRRTKITALRMRTHGDYHLGQVLNTGKDFAIIDLEGEPARSINDRRLKRSAMKDLASMVRSFHYAAHSALLRPAPLPSQLAISDPEGWAEIWSKTVSVVFLRSYLDATSKSGILPEDKKSLRMLFDAYLLEKALYEFSYELDNRPSWAIIPLRGIMSILRFQEFPEPPESPEPTGRRDQGEEIAAEGSAR
jgi:maltose alpha-D-glucosyltransferase/alpha-amylase